MNNMVTVCDYRITVYYVFCVFATRGRFVLMPVYIVYLLLTKENWLLVEEFSF